MRALFSIIFIFLTVKALSGTVSGTVFDENKEPLPGTTIYVVENKEGTVSNADGMFEIPLEPGSYTIIFRFIGFKTFTQRITLSNEEVTLNVYLEPQPMVLNTVVITAGDEDPAYTIMRRAIAKAGYFRNIVDEYRSTVYMKGTGNLNSIPFFIRKKLQEEGIDTARYFVSESVSEIKYARPDSYEEKVVSIRSSGDDNNSSPNNFIAASFYEAEIADVVSPLNPKAFSYYKFEYIGTYTDEGHDINRIRVIPKQIGDHLVNGEISIVEGDWGIHSLQLETSKLGIGVSVDQVYQEFEQLAWLPITHKFTVDGKVLGVGFKYDYIASVRYDSVIVNDELRQDLVVIDDKKDKQKAQELKNSNVTVFERVEVEELPSELPAELTRKELEKQIEKYEKLEQQEKEDPLIVMTRTFSIDSLAFKRDSSYWTDIRPVPLTKKEMIGYRQVDSIAGNLEPDTTADGKRKNRFKLVHLLVGNSYLVKKGLWFYLDSPIEKLGFNTVEGPFVTHGFGIRSRGSRNADDPNIPTTYNNFTFDTDFRYSFSRNLLLPYASVSWSTRKRPRRFGLEIGGGSTVYQFNSDFPVSPLLNAIYTLFIEENFIKLYQADELKLSASRTFNGRWSASFETGYQYRRHLANNNDWKIIDWKDKEYTPNDPDNEFDQATDFPDHNHVYWATTLRVRPWLKYRVRNGTRIPMRGSTPTLILRLEQGVPGLLGGSTDFLKQKVAIENDFDLLPLGTLNFNAAFSSFIYRDQKYFMDHIHFQGNQTIISPGTEFRTLNYYRFSTDEYSLSFNSSLKFKSNVFLARLPFLARKGVKDFALFNGLHVPGIKAYLEVGYGFDYLFKFMRIEGVVSFLDGNFDNVGVRIGLPPDINFN